MAGEITYRIEYDLYQDAKERIARKIEADGEEALALALKEFGFVWEHTCRQIRLAEWLWECSECGSKHDTGALYNYCPNCGAKVVER